MKTIILVLVALMLAGSVCAAVLIKTDSKAAGYNNAAYFAYQQGDNQAALELYELALAEDPTYQLARYNLATLQFELKDFTTAANNLELLVVQDPQNVNYKYDLAVNLVEEMRQHNNGWDRFGDALDLYREVEQLQPGFAHARENIAVMERISADS